MSTDSGIKLVAQNRRARHDYEIVKTYECGIELRGCEVKSLREGKAQLREAYARIDNYEAYLYQMHIPEWTHASGWDRIEPTRRRKLLLHARELDELHTATEQKGLTLVPLTVYFKRGRAKLELAVARGRKRHDKRSAIAERDVALDTARELRDYNR